VPALGASARDAASSAACRRPVKTDHAMFASAGAVETRELRLGGGFVDPFYGARVSVSG
jgi:hypothetical protein